MNKPNRNEDYQNLKVWPETFEIIRKLAYHLNQKKTELIHQWAVEHEQLLGRKKSKKV